MKPIGMEQNNETVTKQDANKLLGDYSYSWNKIITLNYDIQVNIVGVNILQNWSAKITYYIMLRISK